MIINNSNTKTLLLVLTLFIFSCSGDSGNNSDDSAQIDIADEAQDEPLTNSNNETNSNNKTKEETKERIKNLCINLFPLLIFLIN